MYGAFSATASTWLHDGASTRAIRTLARGEFLFLTEDELPWSSKDQDCNSAGQIRMKVDCEAIS